MLLEFRRFLLFSLDWFKAEIRREVNRIAHGRSRNSSCLTCRTIREVLMHGGCIEASTRRDMSKMYRDQYTDNSVKSCSSLGQALKCKATAATKTSHPSSPRIKSHPLHVDTEIP